MDDSTPPEPKRRWYQFSLRTLLVLVTLFAVPCSWYAYQMNEAAKRRAAIAEIIKLGGEVEYYDASKPNSPSGPPKGGSWLRKLHGDEYLGNAISVDLQRENIADGGLIHLEGLTDLKALALTGEQVTDAGLVHLEGLTRLNGLRLTGTHDADLVRLEGFMKGLTRLDSLVLDGPMTDGGLEHLKDLTGLRSLWLEGTQFTDAGLRHLKGMTQLENLTLMETQITDAGLECLGEMSSLRSLNVEDTKVTGEGVQKLQEALPDCQIWHESLGGTLYPK